MSRTKEFAIRLANCVYQYQMSDEAILHSFLDNANDHSSDENIAWLREQIQVVRDNPKSFRDLLGH